MKMNNPLKAFAAVLVLGLVYACEKKVAPVDASSVTVSFNSTNAKSITGDVTVNPKDSIYLEFTINSPAPMTFVEIQKNGVRLDTFVVPAAARNSFSAIKGYRIDSIPGDYTYRVVSRNAEAVFLGDGNKQIKVTVKPDFNFWSYRILQVPDSTSKTNNAFFSSKNGNLYSFTSGANNSALIDFGYYYDTTSTAKHTIYALSAAQPQLNFYDFSSWTKNATLLKKLPSSVNFVSQLTSGGALQTLVGGNMTSGTSNKVNAISTSAGSNVIGFKTVDGKFGAILIRYINRDSPANGTQIEVDVKVQK